MWCHKGQVDEGGTIQSKSLVGIPTSPLLEVGYNGEMTITPLTPAMLARLCRDFEKRGNLVPGNSA